MPAGILETPVDTAVRNGTSTTAERYAPRSAPHVLVVEDNRVHQRVIAAMLSVLECECVVAGDVAQGLAVLADHAFDVVLMDVQLPDVDGFDGARRVRRAVGSAVPPIVAMTAGADQQECLAAGMTDYLRKPVSLDDLTRILNAASARTGAESARP